MQEKAFEMFVEFERDIEVGQTEGLRACWGFNSIGIVYIRLFCKQNNDSICQFYEKSARKFYECKHNRLNEPRQFVKKMTNPTCSIGVVHASTVYECCGSSNQVRHACTYDRVFTCTVRYEWFL